MTNEIKEFIEENIDLIDRGEFEELYNLLNSSAITPSKLKRLNGNLTKTLLGAGIDPAEYMKEIPPHYLENTSLRSYTIPDSVTKISNHAFERCTSLTSIIIPGSVTSIGSNAFSYCSNLTTVTIGNGVKSIGNSAFNKCSGLTSVTIPDSVTSIGESAFSECSSLKTFEMGDGVRTLGNGVFWACQQLENVKISNSITSISDALFSNCSHLTSTVIPSSVTCIEDDAFSHTSLKDIEIPNSVTYIGSGAFYGCDFKSVLIPESVLYIGKQAFEWCRDLEDVTIMNKSAQIGERAFKSCSDKLRITKGGVPYKVEEGLNMEREIRKRLNKSKLQEGVSADNPYLPNALDKYKKNTSFKGIVVSVKDNNGEHEINKLYKTNDDLKKIIQEIERKYPRYYDISAIHDRNLIPAFEKSLEDYKNTPKGRYSSSQLNQMKRNNNKILKAVKDAGLDPSKLTSEKTDKRGRSYKKATPELNKLRKNLFGESIMKYKRLDKNKSLKEDWNDMEDPDLPKETEFNISDEYDVSSDMEDYEIKDAIEDYLGASLGMDFGDYKYKFNSDGDLIVYDVEFLGPYDEREMHRAPLKIKGSDLEEYLGYWMTEYDYEARDKDITYDLNSDPIDIYYLAQEEMDEYMLHHLAQLANKWLSVNGYLNKEARVKAAARGDNTVMQVKFKVSNDDEITSLDSSNIFVAIDMEGIYDSEETFKSLEDAESFVKNAIARSEDDSLDFYIYELPENVWEYYKENNISIYDEGEEYFKEEITSEDILGESFEYDNDFIIEREDEDFKYNDDVSFYI